LINAIYDAAVDWGAWPDALRLISSACASHTTVLTRQGASPEESWSLAPQCDPAYYKSYCSYYHGVNPLRQRAASAPAGTIQTDAIIMPKSELVRTEFYNDFLAPQRLGSMLRPQRRAAVAKVFSRPPLRPTIPISVGRQGGPSQDLLSQLKSDGTSVPRQPHVAARGHQAVTSRSPITAPLGLSTGGTLPRIGSRPPNHRTRNHRIRSHRTRSHRTRSHRTNSRRPRSRRTRNLGTRGNLGTRRNLGIHRTRRGRNLQTRRSLGSRHHRHGRNRNHRIRRGLAVWRCQRFPYRRHGTWQESRLAFPLR